MLNQKIRYGYNDVMIQPAAVSEIKHRKECNPFKDDMLPIFTAPMSTVINEDNAKVFEGNKIIPIIPRSVDFSKRLDFIQRGEWTAVSLKEFNDNILHTAIEYGGATRRILIDVANGNMRTIFNLVKEAKNKFHDRILIMTGNIANVETYRLCCESGIDYVRVGIGGGAGCITSSNTGIHDGIASLLDEMFTFKMQLEHRGKFATKIIADGGIRGFSDVIKALALGADYVMIGSVLAQTVESAASMYYNGRMPNGYEFTASIKESVIISSDGDGKKIVGVDTGEVYPNAYKDFYGMASKYGQIDINGEKTKTSEGIKKRLEVSCNLETWTTNMADYLRSAMSYCNIRDVKDFNPFEVNVQVISNNAWASINR